MAESDSFFDDDDFAESFAGEPSEELLRESEGSFGDLDELGGLDSDTPDAGIPHEEIIAKAQEEAGAEDVSELESTSEESASETTDAAVATKPAKKKGRFGSFDTSQVTIFDLALLISLIFISLATLMMFFELRQFGNFPFDGFPWRTDKF